MSQKKEKKHRFLALSHLPMDIARLVCSPLLLLYRMKRKKPDGTAYEGHIKGGAVLAANHKRADLLPLLEQQAQQTEGPLKDTLIWAISHLKKEN